MPFETRKIKNLVFSFYHDIKFSILKRYIFATFPYFSPHDVVLHFGRDKIDMRPPTIICYIVMPRMGVARSVVSAPGNAISSYGVLPFPYC